MRVLRVRRKCGRWKLLLFLFLTLTAVLLVVPIRNALLMPVLPGLWRPHGTLFLIRMALDDQKFPVQEAVCPSPIKLDVNEAEIDLKFLPRVPMFKEYHQQVERLLKKGTERGAESQRGTERGAESQRGSESGGESQRGSESGGESQRQSYQQLKTLLMFEPTMTPRERAITLYTMEVFINACKAANLTYFLVSGSLMGAIRHHGMIPWDDDFDIMMNGSDWRKIRNVLSNVEGFELFAPSTVQWKFYLKSLPKGNKPFKWPNIDIFFFTENDDYVWSLTWGTKYSVCNKRSDIFPLTKIRFDFWDLWVPNKPRLLLDGEFGDYYSSCTTPPYVHKTGNIGSKRQTSVNCKVLHKYFPFFPNK